MKRSRKRSSRTVTTGVFSAQLTLTIPKDPSHTLPHVPGSATPVAVSTDRRLSMAAPLAPAEYMQYVLVGKGFYLTA
jgi:hypothetical protein